MEEESQCEQDEDESRHHTASKGMLGAMRSDSDGAIGSEDLMGMLSLYGTVFDNGDSTEIFMVGFVGIEDSTFVIPESTDICYFEWLPEFLDVPA